MGRVITTQQAEIERLAARPEKEWALHKFDNIVQAVRKARELGWEQSKVQVRQEKTSPSTSNFYIEPYEDGCTCRSLLRFEDYF